MSNWLCHVCYQLLCVKLGDAVVCSLSPNQNINEEDGVYQWWTTYPLKSKCVSKMHFPTIWRSKFTDLVNSKKLNLWENTVVDKSAWITAWEGYKSLVFWRKGICMWSEDIPSPVIESSFFSSLLHVIVASHAILFQNIFKFCLSFAQVSKYFALSGC